MPLPDNFSPSEHLQSTVRKVFNRTVKEFFSDVSELDLDDLNSSRASLRLACLVDDNDTNTMILQRMLLYYFLVRSGEDLRQPVYGIPIASFQEQRKFKPQIVLFFQEDYQDIEAGYAPVTGEISFRLMEESGESLTEAKLNSLANKIKTSFAANNGFIWKKGKEMFSYSDWSKGYQLQLLSRSEAEGKRLVEQVLDIQSHTPDWKYGNLNKNLEESQAYPTIPPSKQVLGKTRKSVRKRPIADVRFQYALIHIHGLPQPIPLVDRSLSFRNPLVKT